jgi:hypothetical protein
MSATASQPHIIGDHDPSQLTFRYTGRAGSRSRLD